MFSNEGFEYKGSISCSKIDVLVFGPTTNVDC